MATLLSGLDQSAVSAYLTFLERTLLRPEATDKATDKSSDKSVAAQAWAVNALYGATRSFAGVDQSAAPAAVAERVMTVLMAVAFFDPASFPANKKASGKASKGTAATPTARRGRSGSVSSVDNDSAAVATAATTGGEASVGVAAGLGALAAAAAGKGAVTIPATVAGVAASRFFSLVADQAVSSQPSSKPSKESAGEGKEGRKAKLASEDWLGVVHGAWRALEASGANLSAPLLPAARAEVAAFRALCGGGASAIASASSGASGKAGKTPKGKKGAAGAVATEEVATLEAIARGAGTDASQKLARAFLLLLRSTSLLLLLPPAPKHDAADDEDEDEYDEDDDDDARGSATHLLLTLRRCHASLAASARGETPPSEAVSDGDDAAEAEPMASLAAASLAVLDLVGDRTSGGGAKGKAEKGASGAVVSVRGLREAVRRAWGLTCGAVKDPGSVAVDTLVAAVCADGTEDDEDGMSDDDEEEEEESEEEDDDNDDEEEDEDEEDEEAKAKIATLRARAAKVAGNEEQEDIMLRSQSALNAVLLSGGDDEGSEAATQKALEAMIAARKAARPDKAAKRANARAAFQRRIWALDLLEQVRRCLSSERPRRLWPTRRQPSLSLRHSSVSTKNQDSHKTPLPNNFARYLVRLLPRGYMRESYYQQWHNQT